MKNKIDLSVWVTQKGLADELGVKIQNVHNWVQRKKIQTMVLPGNTTLVNKTTLQINENHYKRAKPQ